MAGRRGRGRPPKRPNRAARHARATGAHQRAAVKKAEGRIDIRLPTRRTSPESVVAHLGPTNSGKTYEALRFLAEEGRGVYAGPLRMLAQEAHRRLGERARRRCGRADHGRGEDQRRGADPLLHRRDGAVARRGAGARRGAVGRRRGTRRRLDAAAARRRVPPHSASRSARCAAARAKRLSRCGGARARAQAAAGVDRSGSAPLAHAGHRPRGVQPQGGAGARR